MPNGLNAGEFVAEVGPSRFSIVLSADELETIARQMWDVVNKLKKNPGIIIPLNGHQQ